MRPVSCVRGPHFEELAALSTAGVRRDNNEDAVLLCPPLLAVADGVGGSPAGEEAAALVVETLRRNVLARPPDPERALTDALREANRRVIDSGLGAAATAVAVLLHGTRLSVAHAGDSRAYVWSDGLLRPLTHDHSLVAALQAVGRLTPAGAARHPLRNVVLDAVGVRPELRVEATTVDLRAGDLVLLCSDGLTDPVDDVALAALVADEPDLDHLVERLERAAVDAGGGDDVTIVAARVR
ncbi:MAG: serine/threonine-protein phosphatase [Solirubrobacterales bacterium]|nr:serine/threonine-protein phosphatase [Solirubrobacterales bacterium]